MWLIRGFRLKITKKLLYLLAHLFRLLIFRPKDIHNGKNGNYYYRLKQVDLDGAFEYSEIVAIHIQRNNGFLVDIYPVPAYGSININLEMDEEREVQAAIFDSNGKLVLNDVINGVMPAGNSIVKVPLENLPTGTYFVKVVSKNNEMGKKIIVLK